MKLTVKLFMKNHKVFGKLSKVRNSEIQWFSYPMSIKNLAFFFHF